MMRSYLFVPGDRPDRFDKATAAGADLVVLDLEDAVLPEAKERARAAIRDWLRAGGRAAIRVNAASMPWHEDDLALLAEPGVAAAMLPKAETGEGTNRFAASIPTAVPMVPLVESALGVWNLLEIAKADRVAQIAFGSVDFQLDAGIQGEGEALLYARSRMVLASAIARIAPPIDGVTVALDDESVLDADIAAAKALGFAGKLCIHPRQVARVNQGFAPSVEELDHARRVVEAADAGEAGAIRLDGKLIDRPVVERARRLLESA